MPRTCTICSHPERTAIEKALIAGDTYRSIAVQHSVTTQALLRHKEHIPPKLARSHEAKEVARADTLLAMVRSQYDRASRHIEAAERVLKQARRSKNRRDILDAIRTAGVPMREARRNVELLAKMVGQIPPDQPHITIITSPAWVSLRVFLSQALDAHPEAHAALLRALEEAERAPES